MIGTAFAQSASPVAGGGDTLMGLLPIILMFVVMYFIMIRPQMRKAKEHKTMLEALQKGDEVIAVGILGKIDKITDNYVSVEIAPNVTIQVLPFTAGLPPVTAGSFSVLDSLASGAPDVVYLENKTRVFFIDAETEVHRYTQAFNYLSTQALGPRASLDLIGKTLRDLRSPSCTPRGRGDSQD